MSGSRFRTRLFAFPFAVTLHASLFLVPQSSAEDFLMCRQGSTPPSFQDSSQFRISGSNIQAVFKKILHSFAGDDLSAYFGIAPSILLLPGTAPNAFVSDSEHIILTRGLVQIIENQDELAFVVAHELGHLKLGHLVQNSNALPALAERTVSHRQLIERELDADKFAVDLLMKSGFNPGSGLKLLGKISAFSAGESVVAQSAYPSLNLRIRALSQALFAPICGPA